MSAAAPATRAIWAHARDGKFTVVSKDDDFRSSTLVRGPPPKVIWLQIGNSSTAAVVNSLRADALSWMQESSAAAAFPAI